MHVADRHTEMLVVGGGFSGLGLGYRLKQAGHTDFVILEREADVGGVWQLNTYPGCACDVPSHLYSFSFAPNPDWSCTYSSQPEIRDYLRSCADRFGLRPHLRTGVDVTDAMWREHDQRWEVATNEGRWTAKLLVSAVGPLTEPKLPDVPGIGAFTGQLMHSARWDHDVDLTGRTVASIGTGASAIQYVPEIADTVGRLYVFQRSAPWITPHRKRPISDRERRRYRRYPITQKLARAYTYLGRELLLPGFAKQPGLMRVVEQVSRLHLARQVRDSNLRRLLTPDYRLGCKRLVPSNDWYPALQKPQLILVPKALHEIRERSVIDSDGVERDVDTIIFATGYHVTDAPFADRVRGRAGVALAHVWNASPRAYLGTSVPGFPNFFMLLGPNTGLGHSSMVYMIEAQIEHVLDAVQALARSGASSIEVDQRVHDDYNRGLDVKLKNTVWAVGGCTSFYHDATGRAGALWPDWTWQFRRRATRWNPDAYHLTSGSGLA